MPDTDRSKRFSIRRVAIVVAWILLLTSLVCWFATAQRREMAATEAWAQTHLAPVLAKDPRFARLNLSLSTIDGSPLAVTGEVGSLRDLRDLRDTVRGSNPPMPVTLIVQYPESRSLSDDELIEWTEITGKWMHPATDKK